MATEKRFVMVGNEQRKMPGWYSWRHPTRAEQDAARDAYQSQIGRRARLARALARLTDQAAWFEGRVPGPSYNRIKREIDAVDSKLRQIGA